MVGRNESGDGTRASELALFLDMLMAERGAATHTIEAYRRDLAEFLAFLASERRTAINASADSVRDFLAKLKRRGLAPTSRARKLSAIRQFFRFLLGEGMREDDPCSAIDSPKLGRPLPKILSLAEVETLLATAALLWPGLGQPDPNASLPSGFAAVTSGVGKHAAERWQYEASQVVPLAFFLLLGVVFGALGAPTRRQEVAVSLQPQVAGEQS